MTLNIKAGTDHTYPMRHAGPDNPNYFLTAVEHGDPAGVWWGAGAAQLGLAGVVTMQQMEAVYRDLTDPRSGERLGTAPRNFAAPAVRMERAVEKLLKKEPLATPERIEQVRLRSKYGPQTAVRFLDVTFSMPKSWSVAHAALESAGRTREAGYVWAAIMAGAEAALEFLQAEAGFSRAGYHGRAVGDRSSGRWVDAHDFAVSRWRHHTNRDGEPQLHVHQLVLNRAMCDDGTWRALDSKAHMRARAGAAAVAELVAESELARTLGARFAVGENGKDREIVGVPSEVRDLFSGRRRAIKAKTADLAAAFQEKYGHAPSAYWLAVTQQKVTLDGRKAKPAHPESRSEMLADWERKIQGEFASSLADVAESIGFAERLGTEAGGLGAEDQEVEDFDAEQVVADAVAAVEKAKGVWTRYDLMMEIKRALPPSVLGFEPSTAVLLLGSLADKALAPGGKVADLTAPMPVETPAELRRADGRPVYEPHRPERYATFAQLEREERILLAAREVGAPAGTRSLAYEFGVTRGLSVDQAEATAAIVSSGTWLQVLIGPAGTGKSRTVGTLAATWESQVGGRVLGLAVSEAAAKVLADEGLGRTANMARFLLAQAAISEGSAHANDVAAFGIAAGDLLVVDEASMASTPDLTKVVLLARAAGAKVLLVGDDRQLASVGAGGAMGLVTREVGALELAEVRRFSSEWEGPASLRLRSGEVEVLAEYDRQGRIEEGSRDEMVDRAYRSVVADTLLGRSSVLIAPTNEVASELSSRVREALVHAGKVQAEGVALRDGNLAGTGDRVQARQNEWRLVDTDGAPVRNRDVFAVVGAGDDGSLLVRREAGEAGELGAMVRLPKEYVAADVELGYAVTQHGAQGRTVFAGYSLVDETVGREGLYVSLTRGRERNVAFVVLPELDEHGHAHGGGGEVGVDRFDVLTRVIDREGVDESAVDVMRQEFTAAESMARLGPVWSDVVATEAKERLLATIRETMPASEAERFAADPASSTVFRLLREVELEGGDPAALVREAVGQREVGTAESVAEVLHYRVSNLRPVAGSRALEVGSYSERTRPGESAVGQFGAALAKAMDERVDALGLSAAMERPVWAAALGPVPEGGPDREAWVARAGVVAAYREEFGYEQELDAIGPAPRPGQVEARASWSRAFAALGRPEVESDVAGQDTGELVKMVERYQREVTWAPPNVDALLRQASIAARTFEIEAAEGEAVADKRAAGAAVLAANLREREERLAKAAEIRARWVEVSEAPRARAQLAALELERRELPGLVQPPSEPEGWARGGGSGPFDPETVRAEDAAFAQAQAALAVMEAELRLAEAERQRQADQQPGRDEWERAGQDERERTR